MLPCQRQCQRQKLYCYVDETGQDTRGALFLVSVVVAAGEVQPLREALERIEGTSRKGSDKWVRTNPQRQLAYVTGVIGSGLLRGKIYFSQYRNTREYESLTVLTTARAILQKADSPYEATVFIDGLGKKQQHRVASSLRRLRVRVRKVRGLSDQADAVIRLADAMAGFIRACVKGQERFVPLFVRALDEGIIHELK